MITIQEMRVTFVWTETSTALLADQQPAVPHTFRGRAGSYATMFSAARDRAPQAKGLLMPWPQPGTHKFWWYYLDRKELTKTRGHLAWKNLVPLRTRPPVTIKADWLTAKPTLEGFLYPHGQALVFTARVSAKAPISLNDGVDLLHRVRRLGKFASQWEGAAAEASTLDRIGERGLRWLRELGFGPGADQGSIGADPYSVVTFVRAEGADATKAPPEGEEVHRALEATTSWPQAWLEGKLGALSASRADIKGNSPDGHLLYMRRRGQAVWFPAAAARSDVARRSLSCYHRNQAFAALQIESLGELARHAQQVVNAGNALSQSEDECVRHACGVLGRLYGGDSSVYSSGSAEAHIKMNGLVPTLDALRQLYAMPAVKTRRTA